MSIKKSVSSTKLNIIYTGILLFIIYAIYYGNISQYTLHTLCVLGVFSLIQLIFILTSWYKLTKSFFDAYIIFIVACYAFNLSQPILEIFDAVSPARSIITHYEYQLDMYCQATFISLYFILAFHLGAILIYNKRIEAKSKLDYYSFMLTLKSIFIIAFFFAIISFPGYMYNSIINMVAAATDGYGAIYAESIGTIKIFDLIGEFYVPSIICLYFYSECTNKYKLTILSIIFLTIIVPPLIIGGRTGMMVILSIILLIYVLFHHLSMKKILIIASSCYCVFALFAILAGTRSSGISNLSSGNLYDEKKGNPVLFTLSEMGASIQPLMRTMYIIPNSQDFRYGESYMYAVSTIIPNIGIWKIHPATKHSNLGNWLKDYYNLPFGPGYSIVAEAYYNFGYYGFIMMFFLGCGFTKIFLYAQKRFILSSPIRTVMAIVFLWLTVKMVRNSFEFVIRAIFYYYLPMYWLIKYYANKLIKRHRHNSIDQTDEKINSSCN